MKRLWPKITETLGIWSSAVIIHALLWGETERGDVFVLLLYAVLLQLAILALFVITALWREYRHPPLDRLKVRISDLRSTHEHPDPAGDGEPTSE